MLGLLVINSFFAGIRLSRDTFMWVMPAVFNKLSFLFSNVPFVVIPISLNNGFNLYTISIKSGLTVGSPPVNFIF